VKTYPTIQRIGLKDAAAMRSQEQMRATVSPMAKDLAKLQGCSAMATGVTGTAAGTLPASATLLTWAAMLFDTDSAFNLSAGFTCPLSKAGLYAISVSLLLVTAGAGNLDLDLLINGQAYARARSDAQTGGARTTLSINTLAMLAARNTVSATITPSVNTYSIANGFPAQMSVARVVGF
jgi:hypothetical protein